MKRSSLLALGLMVSLLGAAVGKHPALAQVSNCTGDCNDDQMVMVNELVIGVNILLETQPLERCPEFDVNDDARVSVNELVAGVNNALDSCDGAGNRPPVASDVSLSATDALSYVEKQLIGSDPDNDTITFELIANDSGTGYDFAYVNPETGVLYVTLSADFQGNIVLPYRVTDGRRFSNTATARVMVQDASDLRSTGAQDVDPRVYANLPRGFYNGELLGAPGAEPTLPSSVDLSADFPRPGDQGRQSSCVGWALGYAIKSYQERVENGWSLEAPEHRFSPSYIYNQINNGRDIGSVYLDGLELVVDRGVASLALMPYNEQDFLSQPSDAAHQEAAQFKNMSWKTANGILEIKDALANRLPVFVVIHVLQDLYNLRGPDSVYNTFAGAYSGGHAVAAVGYDDNRYGGALKIINSWSQNWGDGGYFWLPYTAANHIVDTPNGAAAIMPGAVVIEDAPDPNEPPPDPVDPPLPPNLPDLQVTDWLANYDQSPGGAGALQYTITNTGTETAPAGAYVALVLSQDETFSNNILVVYESIPFEIEPGTTAFRDEENEIAFNFPSDLVSGDYYMAVWADPWNDVIEANENDNISTGGSQVEIVNTLPDMEVSSWYAQWDAFGNGSLIYEVINNGASTAPTDWLITLTLSQNDFIGDGDEIFLFSEPAEFEIEPGNTIYRDDTIPGSFSLYFDNFGDPVPEGEYYIALWADPNGSLVESNESNNASLSWGTIGINSLSGLQPRVRDRRAFSENVGRPDNEAYNGKVLPEREGSVRKVRIGAAPNGGRRMELLGSGPGLRSNAATARRKSRVVRARQQVIFPVVDKRAMPASK